MIRSFQLGYHATNFLQNHHGNAGLIPLNTKYPTHQVPERAAVTGSSIAYEACIHRQHFNPFSRYSSAYFTSCKTLEVPTSSFQVGSTTSCRNISRHITDYTSASSANFLPQSFFSSCDCPLAKYLVWGAHTDVFCFCQHNACKI